MISKSFYKFVIVIFLLASINLVSAATTTIYSSKSGYMSRANILESFSTQISDKAKMIYYADSGLEASASSIHYEYFDLSSIPINSKIVSATLYKYHDNSAIGRDKNALMIPVLIKDSQRVTLGKLLESFSESDSYATNNRFKSQLILNKIDSVSDSRTRELVLSYNVTDVVQAWVNGQVNYGFSFLGNYNSNSNQLYYFRNANSSLKPKLDVVYTTTSPSVCGNRIIEAGEVCDSNSISCVINGYAGTSSCKTDCSGFNSCQTTLYCGDNIKNGNEECDSGSNNGKVCVPNYGSSCNYCDSICKLKTVQGGYCGNSIKEASEECDDGNLINGDGCSSICKIEIVNPICGNRIIEAGEVCDSNSISCVINGYAGTSSCKTDCSGFNSCQTTLYCGDNIKNGNEECDDGNIVNGDGCSGTCKIEIISTSLCQYASSGVATSENSGSLARYATGIPNAASSGECSSWSGYGVSWTPYNWNVKATLTLNYTTPVYAGNFTVIGDYDMCWEKIVFKNSKTSAEMTVLNGYDSSCKFYRSFDKTFLTDTIILTTCGWSWSATDAVQLCGITSRPVIPNPTNPKAKNAIVTNIWTMNSTKLDIFKNNNISYLIVDLGTTLSNGSLGTNRIEISNYLSFVKNYETQKSFDFKILPYSEINTANYNVSPVFLNNFLNDYKSFVNMGYDGLLVDIEPVPILKRADFIKLLKNLRSNLTQNSTISVYSSGIKDGTDDWYWNETFFREVSDNSDLISLPGYDYKFNSTLEYKTYLAEQINMIAVRSWHADFMLAVPTHHAEPETIANALEVYQTEIAKYPSNNFIGVDIFAEWTTNSDEWNIFKNYLSS